MVVPDFVARRGQLSDILCVGLLRRPFASPFCVGLLRRPFASAFCVGLFSPVASPLTVLLFQMVPGTFVRFRFRFRAVRAGLSVTHGDGARRCCEAKQ
jgi:hypothetical protein